MKNLGHQSMRQASALGQLLSRPWLSAPVAVDSVILPDSLAEVELSLNGWGWLQIRLVGAPRFIPTTRRFFWRRTRWRFTVPVGDTIAVCAINIWGVKRLNFSIAATSSVGPKVSCMPELSLPRALKQIAVSRTRLTLRPEMKATPFEGDRLSTGWIHHRLRFLPAITGAPAQLPEDLKRALRELKSDSD